MASRSKSEAPTIELRPQPGPQEAFLRSEADICLFVGSAGGGKSYALLLEPLYHVANPRFRAVIFRRTIPQIRQPGGLWDVSSEIYPRLGATPYSVTTEWDFPSGANVKFAGMETAQDRFNWQGAQIPLIAFDEITHFQDESCFWFLLSRCRSMSGVRGYVRGTCNPDPDSWVREFLAWWIDPESGFPIKERSGILRYFVRISDELFWADTRKELQQRFGPDSEPRSVTFIPSSAKDNKILLEKDPSYIANLKALPLVDRARLLDGNWNVRAAAGLFFRRDWFEIVDKAPDDVVRRVRFWDRAATPKTSGNDPDATAGLLLAKSRQGLYFVEDVKKLHASPWQVEQTMRRCAETDPKGTIVSYHQDPGSAGVSEAQATARALDGFQVKFSIASGDKQTRAKPISSQAEAGNLKLVRGPWLSDFLRELEAFPDGRHDDQVDALSGAHGLISSIRNIFVA